MTDQSELLNEVLSTLKAMKQDHQKLSATVETISGRVNILAGVKQVQELAESQTGTADCAVKIGKTTQPKQSLDDSKAPMAIPASPSLSVVDSNHESQHASSSLSTPRRSISTSRIILTTYPGQSGIDPLVMNWGHKDPMQRGPVVVARSQSTIRRRNGRLSRLHNLCDGHAD